MRTKKEHAGARCQSPSEPLTCPAAQYEGFGTALAYVRIRATDSASLACHVRVGGGDEFAILVPSSAPVTPQEIAEQCSARIAKIQLGDGSVRLSVSMGIGEGPTAELARYFADQALYAAKRQGRDTIFSWPERAVEGGKAAR